MGPRVGETPTNTGQVQTGQRPVQPGDTLTKIANELIRSWELPMGTEPERRASRRAVFSQLFRLNPQLAPPEGASPREIAQHAANPALLREVQQVVIPTTKPEVETPAADRMDTGRRPQTETPTNDDPLSPENNTPRADGPQGEEETEEPSGFEKVFGPIRKLFKNPMFQGLMTVLNLIPGINVVVSGLCAIIGLTNIVTKIAQGKGMEVLTNPLELGSTLGYIAGTFLPGLGVMGGLFGMLQHVKEQGAGENDSEDSGATNQETQRNRETRRTNETPADERIPADQIPAHTKAIADVLPEILTDESHFADWATELGRLRQHYDQLIAAAPGSTPAEKHAAVAADNPELAQLFGETLPNAVRAKAGQLAFGLSDFTPTEEATPGRLFKVPQDMTLAQFAATVDPAHAQQMTAALAAYNASRPDEMLKQNQVLYIPDLSTWNGAAHMASDDPAGVRARLVALRRQLNAIDGDQARQALRLIDILEQMAARPAPMPDHEPEPVPAPA